MFVRLLLLLSLGRLCLRLVLVWRRRGVFLILVGCLWRGIRLNYLLMALRGSLQLLSLERLTPLVVCYQGPFITSVWKVLMLLEPGQLLWLLLLRLLRWLHRQGLLLLRAVSIVCLFLGLPRYCNLNWLTIIWLSIRQIMSIGLCLVVLHQRQRLQRLLVSLKEQLILWGCGLLTGLCLALLFRSVG